MTNKPGFTPYFRLVGVLLFLSVLVGCSPSTADLEGVDYTPFSKGDWPRGTPEEQGLEPNLLAKLYYEAEELETLYGLLVIKNGYLIAEKYFNEGSFDQVSRAAISDQKLHFSSGWDCPGTWLFAKRGSEDGGILP